MMLQMMNLADIWILAEVLASLTLDEAITFSQARYRS